MKNLDPSSTVPIVRFLVTTLIDALKLMAIPKMSRGFKDKKVAAFSSVEEGC